MTLELKVDEGGASLTFAPVDVIIFIGSGSLMVFVGTLLALYFARGWF